MSSNRQPDDAPPSYEAAVAAPPTRSSSVKSLLRRPGPTVESLNLPVGELDQIPEEKAHIWPLVSAEHTPPCFSRPVPLASGSDTTYHPLSSPLVINSKPGSSTLEDAFTTVGAPAMPKHDVQESDWEEFLGDVRTAARFSPGQRKVSDALPVAKCIGFTGFLASSLAEHTIRKHKTADVGALLDIWNEKFFKPRRLEVILCRGDKRKSGKDITFLAPDRLDAPPTLQPKQRGGCCCKSRKQVAVEKPYRLVVISI